MIKQIFKIIWKQRRSNVYILVELILVSIFTCYIVDYMLRRVYNSMIPEGFNTERVYLVNYIKVSSDSPDYNGEEGDSLHTVMNLRRFIDRIRRFPDVDGVAIGDNLIPYSGNCVMNGYVMGKDTVSVMIRSFYPESDYFKVFNYQSVSGKSPETLDHRVWSKDDVITTSLSYTLHHSYRIAAFNDNDTVYPLNVRDVLQPIKRFPFEQPQEMFFIPMPLTNALDRISISIRVKEGISEKLFVEEFMRQMPKELNIGNIRFINLTSFDLLKTRMNYEEGETTANRFMIALLVFFWLNMALCIYGTFWLKNEARLCESGIRIAVGCSRLQLFKSYLVEGVILVTIACIIGFVIVANLFSAKESIVVSQNNSLYWINNLWYPFAVSAIITWILITVIVVISAWIPAYWAMKIQPAKILHKE